MNINNWFTSFLEQKKESMLANNNKQQQWVEQLGYIAASESNIVFLDPFVFL